MPPDPDQIADDLRGTFRGRLRFDPVARGLYATDASPFEVTPLGVATPEDEADLWALVRYAHEHGLSLVARGAGTGVAGEALGPGLVVDLSVGFRDIIHITSDTAVVQPGVTLAELNAALARQGRRFAPDPASGATCTLGGMVATNASGGNAVKHGYTRDYVRGLQVVWDTGETAFVRSPAAGIPADTASVLEAFAASKPNDGAGRAAEASAAVAELLRANADIIALTRPATRFNRCGYLLPDALTPDGPDLPKLLSGSEGTLALVTAVALRTVPLPGGRSLALLGFRTVDEAVKAALDLRPFAPTTCDLLDRRLLSATRPTHGPELIPAAVAAAVLLAFEADTEREAGERGWAAVEHLRAGHRVAVLAEPACDPDGVRKVREVREAAVSGLYGIGRGPRPLSMIEDVAVPPELLPDYLTRVQDILQRFELSASFLVHALAGQVHARPLIDLSDPAHREKMWPLAEEVHAVALGLGGTVSTQHGTGIARTPWVEKQYGPLMPLFRELKRVFDPKGILNPGKILGPDPSRPAWPLRTGVRGQGSGVRGQGSGVGSQDTSDPPPVSAVPKPLLVWTSDAVRAEAGSCNGCGDCRPRAAGVRMCPVFRATGREDAAPRAKANVVRLQAAGFPRLDDDAVKAVADLCVNCKMCREECPARVDVPKLMLEAKAAHQAEHGLSRTDWFLARVPGFAALGSNLAPVANSALARPTVRWALERLVGLSRTRRLPALAMRNFFRRARGLGLTKPAPAPGGTKLAYFVDTFAAYADPLVGEAAVAVLKAHGFTVHVPKRQRSSGMAALVQGDVDTAREAATANIRVLAGLVRDGYRVVCSEPTAAVALTQDYLALLDDPDAELVAANTVELTALLGELHAAGRFRTDFTRPIDLTLGHHIPCHVKALRGPAAGPRLLGLIPGVTVHTIDVSCSGMAGTYGLAAVNHATSLAAGQPMLDELNRPRVVFGSTECGACRMQMEEGTGKRTLHPVQYLAFAYGLLPEIGDKLRRPLRTLVSD